jgi:A/G-specific adenine glycosylase
MGKKGIFKFQNMIFNWWATNKRDLPWRHTHDPYKILVSEIMLQQTNVSRVLPKYKEFLIKFPHIRALQKAPVSDVLREWKGMGYNRRALYLKKAAASGSIPETEKELMKLPGVGKYTARAILVFALKKDIAAVDTNIRQIITHFFFKDKPQKEKIIQEVADQLVPPGKSWEWHQALMDYGALEIPKLNIKKIMKKPGIPFKQSNRYMRGKIMDILREGAITEPPEFTLLIDGLVKDGLVERKNGKIQLPDG